MTATVRLTMAQALTRYLSRQMTEIDGQRLPIFGGVWAIFGHGNVAGLGEALWHERERLPTFRAHNEQAMAHAAIAYAKANMRRRFMAATTSIGPGATNLVTAAALAHVNRLPVLLLPGDVFANRIPDPVLQQVEDFGDGTVSANDCFKPVSRYFDRITRPEQIIPALTRAMQVLTDPAECGPVTLALCQDVQAEAYDYPESFFTERLWTPRRPRSDRGELKAAAEAIKAAKKPLIVAGGGVLYSGASDELARFSAETGIPVCETQGGKSALPDDNALNMAAVGVTGTEAANRLAAEADLVLAVGTRLQDFTTGSWALFGAAQKTIIGLNVQSFDAGKHRALPVVADAREGLAELAQAIGDWKAPESWTTNAKASKAEWLKEAGKATAASNAALPSDAQVIGAVQRTLGSDVILLHAAGGLPGELHKLWQAGAGSYLMLNSEIATSVMLGLKLTIVLLDNRGFGCINRLQMATGSQSFNNLLKDTRHETLPEIDFVQHAASMGAIATKAASIAEFETALAQAKTNTRTTVVVIDTDPLISTGAGGAWWDVAVPEVSQREQVRTARANYDERRKRQTIGN